MTNSKYRSVYLIIRFEILEVCFIDWNVNFCSIISDIQAVVSS